MNYSVSNTAALHRQAAAHLSTQIKHKTIEIVGIHEKFAVFIDKRQYSKNQCMPGRGS